MASVSLGRAQNSLGPRNRGPVLIRLGAKKSQHGRGLRGLRRLLLLAGLVCTGYFGYTLANEYVYQSYQNWAFDQQIGGRAVVTFWDYVCDKIHLSTPEAVAVTRPASSATGSGTKRAPVAIGSVLGRVSVPRLGLSAIVREGSDAHTLSDAVGHVSATQFAGQAGNFAIAAHRDTLFRGLKDIRQGDVVSFETPSAVYRYQVFALRVVRPSEVSVLRPDGGLQAAPKGGPAQMLTMITCYPFFYVGSAPERYIVQARLLQPATGRRLRLAAISKQHRSKLERQKTRKQRPWRYTFYTR